MDVALQFTVKGGSEPRLEDLRLRSISVHGVGDAEDQWFHRESSLGTSFVFSYVANDPKCDPWSSLAYFLDLVSFVVVAPCEFVKCCQGDAECSLLG